MSSDPLLNTKEIIENLQNHYLVVGKLLTKINKVNENIKNEKTIRVYEKLKKEIQDYTSQFIKEKNEIENIIDNIESKDENNELPKKDKKIIMEKVKFVKDRLPDKLKEFEKLKNESSNICFPYMGDDEVINNNNKFEDHNKLGDTIQRIKDEKLKERQDKLIKVKETSKEVAMLTEDLKNGIYNQGENLGQIEDNILDVEDNVKKGYEEIKKLNKRESKGKNKKILLLIGGIICMATIIFLIYRNIFVK